MKTYVINSNHDVYIDSYENGELDNVNFYALEGKIDANNPREAIKKYFEEVLYFSFEIENAYIDHEETNEGSDNCLHYSNLVDVNNYEASKREIELWKENKEELYSNNTTIYIYELKSVKI